jgi:hypothetical protein
MRYRRAIAAGETYFFTVNPADRSRRLLVGCVDDLGASNVGLHFIQIPHGHATLCPHDLTAANY